MYHDSSSRGIGGSAQMREHLLAVDMSCLNNECTTEESTFTSSKRDTWCKSALEAETLGQRHVDVVEDDLVCRIGFNEPTSEGTGSNEMDQ